MTFLALDVGNTRLKWALYDKPNPGAQVLGHGAVFLENIDRLSDEDWRHLPEPTHMLGCIVAGEAIRRRVEEQLELWDFTPHGPSRRLARLVWSTATTTPRGWGPTVGWP